MPEKYLGKTVALMITILNVSIPVSQYFFGQMMELLTGRTPLLFIGIGVLMFGLASIGNKLFNFDQARLPSIEIDEPQVV